MIKTDMQLKQDIESELRWDPKVNAAQIGVAVHNGTVSLLGAVNSYGEKSAAERAAKRVSGVRSVAEDLTVKLLGPHKLSDAELSTAASNAIRWNVWTPNTVTVSVQDSRITLTGEVEWQYQREAAEQAVRFLTGVVSVTNSLSINAKASTAQVKEKVEAALLRQAAVDAENITVTTSGGKVTLSGRASGWQAAQAASDAAWSAPGVTAVVDEIHLH